MERSYEKYFRQNRLPHLWCPGCGNGIAMKAIVQAIEKKGLSQDNTVIVSGIEISVNWNIFCSLSSWFLLAFFLFLFPLAVVKS